MFRMMVAAAFAALALAAAACAPAKIEGIKDEAKVAALKKGVTQDVEVKDLFGEPDAITSTAGVGAEPGGETWTYKYKEAGARYALTVEFDATGAVKEVTRTEVKERD
ncbi:MAG: hypothetical protein K8I02_13470 [Candidatus Methylomirabilis sp.]|nr:hypothetical protein [Deltaproteobacteria bacterium]